MENPTFQNECPLFETRILPSVTVGDTTLPSTNKVSLVVPSEQDEWTRTNGLFPSIPDLTLIGPPGCVYHPLVLDFLRKEGYSTSRPTAGTLTQNKRTRQYRTTGEVHMWWLFAHLTTPLQWHGGWIIWKTDTSTVEVLPRDDTRLRSQEKDERWGKGPTGSLLGPEERIEWGNETKNGVVEILAEEKKSLEEQRAGQKILMFWERRWDLLLTISTDIHLPRQRSLTVRLLLN